MAELMKNTMQLLYDAKKYRTLKDILSVLNEADIAALFTELPNDTLPVLFRLLPKNLAADTFVLMESEDQELLIHGFSDNELKAVVDELYIDDAADLIDEMPASVAKRILKQTDAATRKMINHLLAYPDDCAGSIMTTEYIDLKKDMTVDEAFDRIRKIGFDTETIYNCYVIDRSRHLLGIVTVKDLLLNKKTCIISDIMEENIIYANTLDDQEEVVGLFEKYDVLALPVVDKENRLVGIITVDDAIDVMQEEASEDIEKMAAILPSEKTYLKTGVFETFKSRIPWLLFLMISATFTGAVISGYEDKLTQFAALIAFIPMLMGTGGNSGSQSSVTVIRALSLGDIEFKDIWRVIWKELRVSVVSGIVLGAVNFVKIYLVDYLLLKNLDKAVALPEMIIVCLTLVVVVIVAKLVGSILPILAKKINLDPAVMASPLVTTIIDAFSLIIYFGIASAVLGI